MGYQFFIRVGVLCLVGLAIAGFTFGASSLSEPASGEIIVVTTDAAGNASFKAKVAAVPAGSSVTATATHLQTMNTSEFSACTIATRSPNSSR